MFEIPPDHCLYVLTAGSYEDYGLVGVYYGPANVKVEELTKKWAEQFPELAEKTKEYKSGPQYFDFNQFREWFIEEAGLKLLPWSEAWLPDFGPDLRRMVRQ